MTSASESTAHEGSENWNSRNPRSYAMRSRSRTFAVDSPITPTIGVMPCFAVSSPKASMTCRNRALSTA